MPARSPQEIHQIFVRAFNAGDADTLMELYEPDGVLVPEPGQVLTGKDQVRAALQQFLALKGQIRLEPKHTVQTGDLVLIIGDWSLKGTGPDGSPVTMGGPSIEVARRQADGTWLYVIDAPFGQPLLA
jgi:uncharacterized protein (TIGR02246 family)